MHEKHTTQKKQENLRVDATYHRWNFRQKKTNKLQKKNKHSLLFDPGSLEPYTNYVNYTSYII